MSIKDNKRVPVVIVGGGLTGLSLAAQLDTRGVPFVLLEKENRLGGQIQTRHSNGFTYEVGPNTGTVSTPEVAELFEYAAPEATLETADRNSDNRWIWKGDKFHPIPSGIWGGLTTPLFTWKDKFRVPLEPFRKRGTDPNETVGQLAERRLGKSIVEYTIDPFIGGIYAGAPYQLVTRLALPKLYNLEQTYGSFIGGAVKKAKEPKSERDKKATKQIFSAEGGLENLITAVARKIIRTGEVITEALKIKLTPQDGEYKWITSYRDPSGEKHQLESKYVVTTVRADILPSILPDAWAPCLARLATLPYAPVTEVCVGFKHLPDVKRGAFGALVPSKEQRKVLGILFPSSCFRNRVPTEDGALFTIFMGGMRNREQFFEQTTEEQEREGLEELYAMMKLPRDLEPDLIDVARYPKAIPQYDMGTEERHNDLRALEADYPGLFLAGGMIGGIGMANRITQGMQIGTEISKLLP